MARGGTTQLVKIGLIGAGVLYGVGESHKYGGVAPWLKHLSDSITTGLTATGGVVNPSDAAAAMATSAPGALTQSTGASPALQALVAQNPNFIGQAHAWRALRGQRHEDPNAWGAFQLYEYQIQAPNPGPNPPPEWPNF